MDLQESQVRQSQGNSVKLTRLLPWLAMLCSNVGIMLASIATSFCLALGNENVNPGSLNFYLEQCQSETKPFAVMEWTGFGWRYEMCSNAWNRFKFPECSEMPPDTSA